MAQTSKAGGIPGLAVVLVGAGAVFAFTAFRNVSLLTGLRGILKGDVPGQQPGTSSDFDASSLLSSSVAGGAQQVPTGLAGASSARGFQGPNAQIAVAVTRYLGIPYKWGGTDPRTGFDCSGLVWYVLRHDIGLDIPRMTSWLFRIWKGARNISRAEIAAGDLCCYSGHIGIAVSNSRMIAAPTFGKPVQEGPIDYNPFNRVQGRRVIL